MTTPRQLARKRAAQARQQAHAKNLQQGAQELASTPGNAPSVNPDDPLGQVVSSSGQVRVVSAPGVKPTKRPNKGGANVVESRNRPGQRQFAATRVVQSPSNKSVRVQGHQGNNVYGSAKVVSAPPRPQVQQMPQPQQMSQPQQQMQQMPQQAQQMPQGQMAPAMPTGQLAQQLQPGAAARPQADVTVIMTCFERPAIYRRQLEALRNQSFPPAHIMTWVNGGVVQHDERSLAGSGSILLRCNANLGPWTRFTLALEAPSTYVCILDDDTIPGPRWIEACMKRMAEAETLRSGDEDDLGTVCIACAGEIFRSDDPGDSYLVGPESPRPEELEVDIGRQGWFVRKDMIQEFITFPRMGDPRWGWGLHFAAALQAANVFTIVLPYETGNTAAWGMIQPASQERSVSSKIAAVAAQGGKSVEFIKAEAYHAYRQMGWTPAAVDEQTNEAESAPESDEVEG